jgi:hypothetical protein
MLRTTYRHAATLAAIAAAGTLAFGASAGSVNLPVRGKDTIKGTLRPAFDEEYFICNVPQGAAFAVSLKGTSPTGPVFQPALLDDGGPAAGATFVTKGKTISLAPGFVAAASGRYRVEVRGDFDRDGDYELKIAWKTKAAWSSAGGPLAATATDSFTFAAPASAGAVIDVRPASHSQFSGTIVGVTGPDGALTVPPGTTSHLALSRLPSTGDYTVEFRNDGASDGSWTAKAKLKLPRVPADRIDIRDARLTGAFGGDHTVYGSVVGPTGGTLDVTATFGPLDGTSVDVPSGVLPGPTILTVSAAPPLATGADHPAGPAVEFGPPGTTFDPSGTDPSKQATITIPFDPAYFPSGTDSLVIFVRSSSGVVSEVPRPYTFGGNTVSFTTSHFSSYQAATADPRPLSGSFTVLELMFDELPNFEGDFGFGNHGLTADLAGSTLDTKKSLVRWSDGGAQGSSAFMAQNFNTVSLNVTVNDDHSVTTVEPNDPTHPTKFRRGASDDVLVGTAHPSLILRRAGARATVATVAGKWHFFHQVMDTRTTSTQPPGINLEFAGDSGVLNLLADGSVQVSSIRGFDANTPYPTGTWTDKAEGNVPTNVTWDLQDDGSVGLHPPDNPYPIIFNTALDGDVLVGFGVGFGSGQPDDGPASELFVLVRASTDAKLAQMAGQYFVTGLETDTADAKTSGQGFDYRVQTLTVTIAGNGGVLVAGVEDAYSHDGQGLPFQLTDQPLAGPVGRITLKSDGSFTSTDGAVGAFSRKGDFFVRSVSDGTTFSLVFGTPLVLKSR